MIYSAIDRATIEDNRKAQMEGSNGRLEQFETYERQQHLQSNCRQWDASRIHTASEDILQEKYLQRRVFPIVLPIHLHQSCIGKQVVGEEQ